MQILKSDQLSYKKKRKRPKVTIKESALQKQCDDLLKALRIKYLRIPDYVWSWLKRKAPVEIITALSEAFAGMPDNITLTKISDRYALAMGLELKTEAGKLSGKQKKWIDRNGGVVSRSPDDTIKEVDEFIKVAEILKTLLVTHKDIINQEIENQKHQ